MSRARDALREKGVLLLDCGADCGGDVAEVVVGHPRAGGEAEAGAEEGLADAVGVRRGGGVDGLAVHRFPEGSRLDACGVEGGAHCLDVCVWLAVGGGRCGGVGHSRCTADGAREYCGVCLVLPPDPEGGVDCYGAEPEVGAVAGRWVVVEGYAGDSGEQAAVLLLHVAVVGDVVVEDGHLPAPDSGADV